MGYSTWNSLFATNANPDYPDGLVTDFSAGAGAMSSVFGKTYRFNTDGTGVTSDFPGYTFNSFEEAAGHAGQSWLLAGVTTKPAIATGLQIGFKIVEYMDKR